MRFDCLKQALPRHEVYWGHKAKLPPLVRPVRTKSLGDGRVIPRLFVMIDALYLFPVCYTIVYGTNRRDNTIMIQA